MDIVYKVPNEMMGVKKTMQLLKIVNMPISPALSIFTKNGKAANDIALHNEAVMVYMATCLKEVFSKIDFMLCNKIG